MVLTFPEFIFLICNVYSPDASEKYAIDVPFGDHSGYFSCTPVVAVVFSGSPFSAGTVTMSPLKSTTTLAPEGEIDPERT